MQVQIQKFELLHTSLDVRIKRPFQIEMTVKGFVTSTEMRMLQMAEVEKLPLSAIGCAKLRGKLK